jgi:hypothetical protein
MRRVSVAVLGLCVLIAWPSQSRADKIGMQVRQLRNPGAPYKLRLSAALSLARTRDRRAIAAMIYALRHDRRGTVRRVAALSLTKMIDGSVPVRLRNRAIAALEAAQRDSDKRVRRSVRRALKQLGSLRKGRIPKVFIRIPKPVDSTRRAGNGARDSMHKAVKRAIRKHAPSYAQRWPSGKLPTKSQLRRAGTRAYWVGATVQRLNIRTRGGRAEIICTVSVRINPWSGRDGRERMVAKHSAHARGSGKVIGSNTSSGIAGATRDCLAAVSEELTARQVVPFLKRLAAR